MKIRLLLIVLMIAFVNSFANAAKEDFLPDLAKVPSSRMSQLGQNFLLAEQLCYHDSFDAALSCFFNYAGATYISPRGGVYLMDPGNLRMAFAGTVTLNQKSNFGFYFEPSDIYAASRRFILKDKGLEYTLDFQGFFKAASVYQSWFQKLVKTSEFQTFWNMKDSDHAIYSDVMERTETILLLQDASEDDFVALGEPIYFSPLVGNSPEALRKLRDEASINGVEELLQKSPLDKMGVHFWVVVRIKDLPKLDQIAFAHRLLLSVQYIGDESHLASFKETHKSK